MAVAATGSWVKADAPERLPAPPPDQSTVDNRARLMVLEVHFANDGRVQDVHAVRTSGSDSLDKQTISYISQHWTCPRLAGHTAQQMITFYPPPQNYRSGELREGEPGSETMMKWVH
jgi:hypothetical protein